MPQACYWPDITRQLGELAHSVNHTTEAQLRHPMALVEFWGVSRAERKCTRAADQARASDPFEPSGKEFKESLD